MGKRKTNNRVSIITYTDGFPRATEITKQVSPFIASARDFIRLREKAKIASDPFAQFDDYAEIMAVVIPPLKSKRDDAIQAEDQQALEDASATNEPKDVEMEEAVEDAEQGQDVQHVQEASVEPRRIYASDPRIVKQHDEHGRRLTAYSNNLQPPTPVDQVTSHASQCQINHCPSCQTYGREVFIARQQTNRLARTDRLGMASEHQGVPNDLQRVGASNADSRIVAWTGDTWVARSTTPPGFGSETNDGVIALSEVLALHNRVEGMGLSREAAQFSFPDVRGRSERSMQIQSELDTVETLTEARPSLYWNDAKRRNEQRRARRSRSADVDLRTGEETSTGLGISGIAVEQGLSRMPPVNYQRSSIVPLPTVSVASSPIDSGSDEYETESGEDGILGEEDEGDENVEYVTEGEGAGSDEDDADEEEVEAQDEDEEEQEGEEGEEEEDEEDDEDDDVPGEGSQASNSTVLCDSDGQQVPKANFIGRKRRQLLDLPPVDGSSESPARNPSDPVRHPPSSGKPQDMSVVDIKPASHWTEPTQTGDSRMARQSIGMNRPEFSRSKVITEAVKERNLPMGVVVASPSRGNPDTTEMRDCPRVRFSSFPAFSEVLKSSTDATFFLAWYRAVEQFKQQYPNSEMVHDTISGGYLKRFLGLCAAQDANNNPLWSIDKAEREVAEHSSQIKMKQNIARSTRISETSARTLGQAMLPPDQPVSQNSISLLDDSWMDDPTGVMGIAMPNVNLNKRKKKRKAKQAGRRPAIADNRRREMAIPDEERQEENEQLSDADSVAAEVDDMTLAEVKLGAALSRRLSPEGSTIEVAQDPAPSIAPPWVESVPETNSTLTEINQQPVLPLTPGLTPKAFVNHRNLPDTRENVGAAHGGLRSGNRGQDLPFRPALDPIRVVSGITTSPGLDPEDVIEGGYLGQHPVHGNEVVILTKPRAAPPYARSLFVTGIARGEGITTELLKHTLRAHFNAFHPVERVKIVCDEKVCNAFVAIDTATHAQHITTLAEAKTLTLEIKDLDGRHIRTICQQIRVEMAQGSKPIRIRLRMPDALTTEFPFESRMGKPIPGTVFFERYLEPAGRDQAASREKFRIRHRIDLTANFIFPFDRNREREDRSSRGNSFPLAEGLRVDLTRASSEEEAIRMLCQPFGEIESIVPLNGSHPANGFAVRFLDRDVTLRARQQLPLLMGVGCYAVTPNQLVTTLNDRNSPIKLVSTALPDLSSGSSEPAKTAFADAVKGRGRLQEQAPQQEDWPALPKLKLQAEKKLPNVLETPELDMDPNLDQPQQAHVRKSRILSPVSEERSPVGSGDDGDSGTLISPPVAAASSGSIETAVKSESAANLQAAEVMPSITTFDQSDNKAHSAGSVLGLVDVPPLQTTGHLSPPEAVSVQPSQARYSPIVQLGSLPHADGLDRSGIKRMTVLVHQLPAGTTHDTLRERFKPYGRLTDVQIQRKNDNESLEATVSFTSMASARQAVSKDGYCEIVGTQELSRSQQNTISQTPERPSIPRPDPAASEGDVHAWVMSSNNSRSEPLLHQLARPAEHFEDPPKSANSRRSYTRAQSDPGRTTPGNETGDIASSDDSKSETGLDASDRSSPRPVSTSELIFPSMRKRAEGTGVTELPTPVFAGVERPDAAELAKQLAEANEQLSRWQAWAVSNGMHILPPQDYMADEAGPIPSPLTRAHYTPAHAPDDIHTALMGPGCFESFHPQGHPSGNHAIPAHVQAYTQERVIPTNFDSIRADLQEQGQTDHTMQSKGDNVSVHLAGPETPGNVHLDSGRLQPVKVIDTPQGLYALYDKTELLAYKKRIPTTEVPAEPASQDPPPLYPLWSGGHPPEKQWMNPSNELQYRQAFQYEPMNELRGDHIVFPPTPRTSTFDYQDHRFLDSRHVESARRMSNASEEGSYSIEINPAAHLPQQSQSFIHHPIPLPRPGAHRHEFNLEVSSPAPMKYPLDQNDQNDIRTRTPLKLPSLHRPHTYTASVRVPSRYQPQEPDSVVTQRYRSGGYPGPSHVPSGYRGTGSNRRGLGRRGMQGNHGYNAYSHVS